MTEQRKRTPVLIVDDKEANLLALEGWLADMDLDIVKARSGNEALEKILEADFALVLLDVQMPGMDGFETAELMRGTERTRQVPIIFITAISKEEKHIFKGYEAGAVDYIFKPLEPHILRSKVSVFVRLHRQSQKLRQTIAELRQANETIRKLSISDPLTGCFNRGYFNEQLPKEIKRAIRYQNELSLVLIDIDHFKKINDTCGHQGGDEVLKAFTDLIESQTRKDVDWIARYGGEEFALVLPETDIAGAEAAAEKLRKLVAENAISFEANEIYISASFGAAALKTPDPETDPEKAAAILFDAADEQLYSAKQLGRNRVAAGK